MSRTCVLVIVSFLVFVSGNANANGIVSEWFPEWSPSSYQNVKHYKFDGTPVGHSTYAQEDYGWLHKLYNLEGNRVGWSRLTRTDDGYIRETHDDLHGNDTRDVGTISYPDECGQPCVPVSVSIVRTFNSPQWYQQDEPCEEGSTACFLVSKVEIVTTPISYDVDAVSLFRVEYISFSTTGRRHRASRIVGVVVNIDRMGSRTLTLEIEPIAPLDQVVVTLLTIPADEQGLLKIAKGVLPDQLNGNVSDAI